MTSAPVEGAMEGGETRRELLNQGASEEEATKESLITMGKNIPLLLATNALEGLAFFSPLKGANKALQIAGRAVANSAQEQYEEFAQEGIQNAARGEPAGWLPWNGAPNQYEAAETRIKEISSAALKKIFPSKIIPRVQTSRQSKRKFGTRRNMPRHAQKKNLATTLRPN